MTVDDLEYETRKETQRLERLMRRLDQQLENKIEDLQHAIGVLEDRLDNLTPGDTNNG